ncbi:MAG: hypothetical protein L6R45_13835 [Anaerolineae bacterium]|nr:hypothetical protein [Anaerolineae bacterium]
MTTTNYGEHPILGTHPPNGPGLAYYEFAPYSNPVNNPLGAEPYGCPPLDKPGRLRPLPALMGHLNRQGQYRQSDLLEGVRDGRDYRIHSSPEKAIIKNVYSG